MICDICGESHSGAQHRYDLGWSHGWHGASALGNDPNYILGWYDGNDAREAYDRERARRRADPAVVRQVGLEGAEVTW